MSIPVGTVVGDDRLSPCSGSSNSRRRGKWLALLLTLLLVTWFLSISYAVAGIEFSFSIGEGVNAYYLPTMNTFIYSGNEIYYEWSGDGWLYSRSYYGPWLPVAVTMVVPTPLLYGPPPPVFSFRPYFVWWRARVAPWYRIYHPHWWLRYHPYMSHYRVWRARVIPLYRDRPFYLGRIHPVLRPMGGRIDVIRRIRPPAVRRYIRHHPLARRVVVAHPYRLQHKVVIVQGSR